MSTIRAMGGPVAMRPVVHGDSDAGCDLTCSDVVSEWINGADRALVAACPGNDLELTVVACLGSNGLPQTPLASAGLKLREVALAGDTVVCAGPLEQRLIADIWESVSRNGPPLPPIMTSLLSQGTLLGQLTVAYMRPKNNPDVVAALERADAVSVLLPELDASIFAIRQPLAKLSGTTVSSTSVLVGWHDLDRDPRVWEVVQALTHIDPFWALSELNYASKVMHASSLLPSTRAFLQPLDRAALSRQEKGTLSDSFYGIPSVPVLQEGYTAPRSITLLSNSPVQAYMTSTSREGKCRVLEMQRPFIGAARMRLGDRVQMRAQAVSKHNGDYIVQQLQKEDRGTVLVSWVEANYNAVTFQDVVVGASFAMVAKEDKIEDLWPRVVDLQVGDLMLLRNLHNPDGTTGVWTSVTRVDGSDVTIQTLNPDANHTPASDGSCMSSPTTEIKSVCKANGGIWDAPCTWDDQCPYFQKNLEYPNYRGGCKDSGWCEMPLGVTQPSYRIGVGEAVCHGRGCGQAQDIAFPLDQFERYVFGLN